MNNNYINSNLSDSDDKGLMAVTSMFANWVTNKPDYIILPLVKDNCVLMNMINRKINSYGIHVKFSNYLMCILEICGNGNPGLTQLIVKELIDSCMSRRIQDIFWSEENPYEITISDFVDTFMLEFPYITDSSNSKFSHVKTRYEKYWDMQKTDKYTNGVDCPEWWKTQFFEFNKVKPQLDLTDILIENIKNEIKNQDRSKYIKKIEY